ncbi:TOS1 [Candida pseudojiufengensis]|uniref:TOS1 n=1 Tax=Candida pseudojiufengensis TaxID=497109 RepID=UPI0022248564|nr:TOS1 [Candida pseudojiufengensis]KAI5968056.1 TOS1 [Candida pseudojiufengensis]
MKFTTTILFSILSSLITNTQASCTFDGGNYYCSETSKIIYKNIGFSGSYQDVTNMNEITGKCTQETFSFNGNLSPLDEELSVHFRGPLKLKQFGVYYPSTTSQNNKKRDDEDCNIQHFHHKHKRATEIVQVTQTVFVDGNGNLVTSQQTSIATEQPQQESSVVAPAVESAIETAVQGKAYRSLSTKSAPTTTSSTSTASTSSSSSSTESSSPSGSWERSSYYTPGSADNCVFLNYHGGSGSGIWSSVFGNSLSYANSDNSGGSSSPIALADVTIGSNNEFVIMSGSKCDSSCGYYREGSVAHHGFGGKFKIFIFEFEMPSDNSGAGFNVDMPAIWLLNAKIPRTLQYGDSSCSCWKTGCGELDLFEILSSGSNKLISHLHDGQGTGILNTNNGGGGSQDYFVRPSSGSSLKAAVIFNNDEIHIIQVDDSTNFGDSLDENTVNGWLEQSGSIATIGY